MFWKKNDNKLAGPRDLPDIVKKSPELTKNFDAGAVPFLKMVTKTNEKDDKTSDIRIFDPSDAEARSIQIKNYTTLTEHAELVLAEGSYSDQAKKVELTIKRAIPPVKILTVDEIQAQIEALKEPGSSVFFYMAAGPGAGGPLGRGASIIRLNNPNDEKKAKKYSVFGAPVIGAQPAKEKEILIFSMDKSKDIAKWVSEGHKARFC